MLFFGKKPSISQKACWAESAWRKVSPAVLDAGSRAYAAFASSPFARRARWAGALGVVGRAGGGQRAARSHAEAARRSKMAPAAALRRPNTPLAPRGGRSARRRGTISPIFLACVATHKNNG